VIPRLFNALLDLLLIEAGECLLERFSGVGGSAWAGGVGDMIFSDDMMLIRNLQT
jgi:hypothetical protein